MARGAATRDKVANMVSGADAIEIKATIPEAQIEAALQRYQLTSVNAEERTIYFFDTPALDLLQKGIIARVRRIPGGEHDCTLKVRPVEPDQVAAKWREFPGFKIEADASEKGVIKSASFSMPVEKGLIKAVVAGEKPVKKLFTDEQCLFVEDMLKITIDFPGLSVLGPLHAYRWKFEDPACPWRITAELWRREDGARLVEASIKAPIVQAAVAIGGFMALLAEAGAERDKAQQTKTRWALEYYAAKLGDKVKK